MGYESVFGGSTIYPSDVSYLALALTANTTLEWPLEAATGDNIVARIIDVTPTSTYSITMPDATETAAGQVTQFYNVGASTITVKDNAGSTLLTITTGQTWTLYLTSSATVAGTWRSFQAGSVTSQAQASALAGYGLTVTSATLSQEQDVTTFNADYTAGAADRAAAYVWTGGLGTLTLTAASTLGNGWFMSIRNGGTGNLTVDPSGAATIDGASTLILRPGDSAVINTDGTSFYTVGLGQDPVFAFDFTAISLTGQVDTYTLSGAELNRIAYQFTGILTTNMIVYVPATTQQYWVANDTTGGAYTLSIATATQASPLGVTRGSRGIYYSQGSDVIKADTASVAIPIGISDGGTGSTSASGARISLGGTAVGIAVFIAASAAAGRTALGSTVVGDAVFIAANAAAGRSALTAAASGANSDITSLTGLTTPLTVAQGGTGLSSLGSGVATFLGTPSSANLAAAVTGETGTGALVFADTPTLATPVLGIATATSINKVALTAPASSATLTIADGKTLTASNTLTLAGTDGKTLTVSHSLTLAGTDSTTMTFPPASASVGYLNIPQNSQSADYTAVAADSGKHLFHPAADANNRTFTIPANASVAYVTGTAITFVNMSTNNLAIAITSDTLYLAGVGTTGSRTLARYGEATALKISSTEWVISGAGLT